LTLVLRPDTEKKSVFWFDPPTLVGKETEVEDLVVSEQPQSLLFPYHIIRCDRKNVASLSSLYQCTLTCSRDHNDDHYGTNEHDKNGKHSNGKITDYDDFMMAGFQVVSNAQQIQVYLIVMDSADDGVTGKAANVEVEVLLTTVKGIPMSQTNTLTSIALGNGTNGVDVLPKLYKTQCVIPGGPRPVRQVRLVFQSLSSITTPSVTPPTDIIPPPLYLEFIRWTIRVPMKSTTNSIATTNVTVNSSTSQPINHSNVPPPSANPFFPPFMTPTNTTQESSGNGQNKDIMMAISGIAMTLRSMEERMMKQSSIERSSLQDQIRLLSQQVQSISDVIQHHILKQQQMFQDQLPEMITTIVQEQLQLQRQQMNVQSSSSSSSSTCLKPTSDDDTETTVAIINTNET
jgi:hypothetical protein